jgi:hypothetical protein
MRALVYALLALGALLAVAAAVRAADGEAQVYFFHAASCEHSQKARAFLERAQSQDPQLRVRAFEVEQSSSNLELLGKVYARIGFQGLSLVPVTVIGSHVVVGYVDDGSTGRDILERVAECRRQSCPDKMRDLLEDRVVARAALIAPPAPKCTTGDRRPRLTALRLQ